MDAYDFNHLCRQAGYLLNLDDADALEQVGRRERRRRKGRRGLSRRSGRGLTVYVDVGQPQDAYAESEVFRHLLDINLELSAQNGESFAVHRDSGHVLLPAFSVSRR